jgi:hypothetical protein
MADYRLYCLDRAGRITVVEELSAHSDDDAIAQARHRTRHGSKCEVWKGRELLLKLDAQDKQE